VNKKDANDKFLRDVRAILNKLTPQNKDKLLKQLEELELDRPERLEGMINIIFSKAVEEPKFCPMYSELCKKFQKKQVTVPSEDGETVTYYFRQILLTRCQNGFQSDYRTDINYDNRKKEVDAITDEKKHKEEAENLEEALFKAKRRNFGNIL
jgi:translation initiation factor 4G